MNDYDAQTRGFCGVPVYPVFGQTKHMVISKRNNKQKNDMLGSWAKKSGGSYNFGEFGDGDGGVH